MQATVIVIVRKGQSFWVGANSAVSGERGGKLVRLGDDCKIYPLEKYTMVHEGANIMIPWIDHVKIDYIEAITTSIQQNKSLAENRTLISKALKAKYLETSEKLSEYEIAHLLNLEHPDPWIPEEPTVIYLLRNAPGEAPELNVLYFELYYRSGKEFWSDRTVDYPHGDFSLILDGTAIVHGDEWKDDGAGPVAWITKQIKAKAAIDSLRWGGEIATAKITAEHGFEWIDRPLVCNPAH